jgi:hypothetical protein
MVLFFIFTDTLGGDLIKKKTINLFLILLIFCEIVTVFKLIAFVLSLSKGGISFYLGTAIQIVFGILFSFININTKEFRLNYTEQK